MKQTKQIKIPLPDDNFGAVLNCAVRYSLGRCTYMPYLVTSWIMENCHNALTAKTLFVMKRDIDEAAEREGLGMKCDVETWMRFRAWLDNEEGVE